MTFLGNALKSVFRKSMDELEAHLLGGMMLFSSFMQEFFSFSMNLSSKKLS